MKEQLRASPQLVAPVTTVTDTPLAIAQDTSYDEGARDKVGIDTEGGQEGLSEESDSEDAFNSEWHDIGATQQQFEAALQSSEEVLQQVQMEVDGESGDDGDTKSRRGLESQDATLVPERNLSPAEAAEDDAVAMSPASATAQPSVSVLDATLADDDANDGWLVECIMWRR